MSTGVVGGGKEPGCYASIWTVEIRRIHWSVHSISMLDTLHWKCEDPDEKNQTNVYAISWKFDYTISATFVSTNVAEI